jgi:serine/threonine-protein kinase HipA
MVAPGKRRSRKRHSLNVWMNGQLVGTWTVAENRPQRFQYEEAWVKSQAARILSLSLPFQPGNQPHEGKVVENFFDNLLPESKDIRERLQRKFQAKSGQAFDMLDEIGRDCVGAVQLIPEDEEPNGWDKIAATPLTDTQVEHFLKAVVTPAFANQDEADEFRISIAGAQEKTALLWHEGRWHAPHGATPTTHMLKLPLGLVGNMQVDMSTSVENEWLCSKIIATYGMDVADCHIQVFGETKVLVVKRFDRRLAHQGTYWLRLPQEDMCQATGTSAADKYETDGGPGMKEILDLLRGSSQQDHDRRAFLKTQILFWMLAAPDGHAKNFSIFHERNATYRMTPLYDVLSAWPIIGEGPNRQSWHDAKVAMAWRSKNPHRRLSTILRRHFNKCAAKLGVGKEAEDIIQELLVDTPRVIDKVREQLPSDFPARVSEQILDGLSSAADRLNDMPPQ